MNAFPRWAGWAGLFLVLCNLSVAKPKWNYARTEHFELYTSSSVRPSRELLNDLEQFRAGFRKAFALPENGEMPVTVVIFDTSGQFEPYMPLYKGKVKQVGGYCAGSPAGTMIALSADDWEYARKVIFHEYVHRVIHESGYTLPSWLNEGLAVLYATAVIGKDSIKIGAPEVAYLGLLSQKNLMPLDRLVNITHSSSEYNESNQASLFYATSWLFAHYLICGADVQNQTRITRFLQQVGENKGNPEQCFREAFGLTYLEMQKVLETYRVSGKFFSRVCEIEFPNLLESISFSPADPVACEVTLENLRWLIRRVQKEGLGSLNRNVLGDENLDCAWQLARIAERAPHSPKPHEVLGAIALAEDGNWEQATTCWQKAADLGSDNAYVYLQLASVPMRDVIRFYSLDYRMPQVVAEPIRANLDRAVALRPDYFDAWEMLAEVEAMAEKPRAKVLEKIQKLVPQMRKPARTLAALAIIRWHIKDYETCAMIVNTLEEKTDDRFVETVARGLRKRLAQREQRKAAAVAPSPAIR